jgi:hypothetical protein
MKVTGYISMYSGRQNPEMDLSPEVSKHICELLYKAYEESEKPLHHKLGFNGYIIAWYPEDGESWPAVHLHVYNGVNEVRCFATCSSVKDTVGLETYLAETLSPCLQKHQEDMAKAMAEYYENLSGISQQEKV